MGRDSPPPDRCRRAHRRGCVLDTEFRQTTVTPPSESCLNFSPIHFKMTQSYLDHDVLFDYESKTTKYLRFIPPAYLPITIETRPLDCTSINNVIDS